jgi:hypothetical protein
MNKASSVSVDLAAEYPVYKQEGDALVRLAAQDPNRKYKLTTDAQTGETLCLQLTSKEEAQAERQNAEWLNGAADREAEAKRQAEEATEFENSIRYQTRIVAFVDILGWTSAIQEENSSEFVRALGKTLIQLQSVTNHFNSLSTMMPDGMTWPGNPILTQFSDSLLISVDDDEHGRFALQNALQILSSNLIGAGRLIRGGVARGEIFHNGSIVFGPALIEAYKLESKCASSPRVILSQGLGDEWGGADSTGALPWVASPDGYLFFNFLPPFMGCPFHKTPQLWQTHLGPVRKLILETAQDPSCPEVVFSKYLWLAAYFDKVCGEFPECGVEKVMQLAVQMRWARR